jgi:hypothetical protein
MLARPEWTTPRAQPRLQLTFYILAALAVFALLVLGDAYVMWVVLKGL